MFVIFFLDMKWLPINKVRIVSEKLSGVKPSSVTLKQLKERHSDEKYYSRYEAIVKGTDHDGKSARSLMAEDGLSPEDQVTLNTVKGHN